MGLPSERTGCLNIWGVMFVDARASVRMNACDAVSISGVKSDSLGSVTHGRRVTTHITRVRLTHLSTLGVEATGALVLGHYSRREPHRDCLQLEPIRLGLLKCVFSAFDVFFGFEAFSELSASFLGVWWVFRVSAQGV